MNSVNDVWENIMQMLSNQLTSVTINTWFSDVQPVEITDGKLVLHTATKFKKQIIQERYGSLIRSALTELFSSDFQVVVLSGDELDDYKQKKRGEFFLPEMDGYTFKNFIVGNSNRYAHAAAMGVTKNPGNRNYNPLLIYGNSGLGKTHLLLAIGSAIHESMPEASIVYIKGDEFTNQLVASLQGGHNKAEQFRQKYRNIDLFLVDDIQFIAGKEQTQEEFFHTFNNLYEAGHQIVITSDRPPIDMLTLDNRLRTRFEGGLMADVQPPDVETRMAIIKNKAGLLGMTLPENVVQYIADTVTSNIRQIEGVVKRLTAYRDLDQGEITIDSVKRAMKDVIRIGTFIPTPEIITEETARYFSVRPEDMLGQKRTKAVSNARQVAMFLTRQLTNLSLNDIGAFFGGRNHSTVLISISKVEESVKVNHEMTAAVRDITSNINSRQ